MSYFPISNPFSSGAEEMLWNRSFVNYEAAQDAIREPLRITIGYGRIVVATSIPHRRPGPQQAHQMQSELTKKWRVRKRSQPEKVQPKATKIEA